MKQLQTSNRSVTGRAKRARGSLTFAVLAGCVLAGAAAAGPTRITSLPMAISQPGLYEIAGDLSLGSVGGDGILITASDVTLKGHGHTLSGPGTAGIEVYGASRVTITDVKVTGFDKGIKLDTGVSDATVSKNSISSVGTVGIELESANDNSILDNSVSGSLVWGIQLFSASHNTLANNNVSNNPTATAGIKDQIGSGNTLSGNQASSNGGSGIWLDTTSGDTLSGNVTNGNHVGILLASTSPGNTVEHNSAQGNTVFDLEDDSLDPCQNGWADNRFVTDNERGLEQGPMFGCIR